MFSGLVRLDGHLRAQPDLAQRWDVSPDGLVWTFYLRKGVKFHKGYGELTSEDVKFSIEKAANKATSGFAADYAALGKVEAVDKYTVRLTFKTPIPSVLGILANYHGGYIISKKAYEERGEKFKFDPNKFSVEGKGWDNPADPNDPNNNALNRRVEISVLPPEQK